MSRAKPKVLLLDIETAPAIAYVWSLYDDGIPLDRLIRPGRTLCWAAKWLGQPETYFDAEWNYTNPRDMFKGIHALMSQADAICTYNGDKFDLPKLMGGFVEHKLPPPPPVASIDLYKTVKTMGWTSGKLAHVAPLLRIGSKVKHEGFGLWTKVMNYDPAAQKRMERYNKGDVRLLDRLYRVLQPYVKTHPYLGEFGSAKAECPRCGSRNVQARGWRRTRLFRVQRVQCQSCGGWHDGRREKVK